MTVRSLIGRGLPLAVLLAFFAGHAAAGEEERSVVLVAARESPLNGLPAKDLRLAYLAVPVRYNDLEVRPVINETDPLLHEIFLQKVMYLSAQHYRRQVLARVFRRGGSRPTVVEKSGGLVETLAADPRRVSYMWRREAEKHPNLRILGQIWKGRL